MTRRQIVRAPRRARQWAITFSNVAIVAATQAAAVAIPLLSALETDLGFEMHNVTISALKFNINYRLTNSTTGDDCSILCAVAWVSDSAFAAGGVALPDPSVDHYDWMFWDHRTLSSSRDVVDIDEQVIASHLVIDNKSMRKQRENNSTLMMIFRSTLMQPSSVQCFVGGRALVLLP